MSMIPPWRIMQPSGANLIQTPPPLPGTGMMSELGKKIENMDVVGGFDRTLGKTKVIPLQNKSAQFDKIKGTLSAKEAAGRLSGPLYA